MNVRFDFTGKIVLVTGDGSGIGLASSRAFAAAGAHRNTSSIPLISARMPAIRR
jgi:NADP-dependent 3-hydroxy acid dehydrogenase YdfG